MTSKPHALLALHLKASGAPIPVHEHRFAPPRRFRFDLAFPEVKIGIEVDGGGWVRGRHHRPLGHASDCEKRNLAVELGWRVLTYVPEQIESGEAIKQIVRIMRKERVEDGQPCDSARRSLPR